MLGRKVPGEGNPFNAIIAVGEGPGRNEAEQGRPFVGLSGFELDRLFKFAARLKRADLWLTNLVKWRTDEEDRDPNEEEVKRNEPELYAELEMVKPRFIITIGKISTSWFLGAEADMEHREHGIPQYIEKFPDAILIPCLHPAASLRLPERYAHLVWWDFEQVGKVVRGELRPVENKVPNPVYTELK